MTFKIPFTQTLLTVAIAMALAPATSYAALKPSDIQGLPQTGTVKSIQSGKTDNGDTVFTWSSDKNVYGQRIRANGTLDGTRLDIANDATVPFAGLAVKNDGSFISAWPTSSGVMGIKVESNVNGGAGASVGTPFTVDSLPGAFVHRVLNKSNGFAIAWRNETVLNQAQLPSSLLNFDETAIPEAVESIGDVLTIAMDSQGDFFVAEYDGSMFSIKKNNDQTVDIPASQVVNRYAFGDGTIKNKSVDFSRIPVDIATNSAGDFVVVWSETKDVGTRKPRTNCPKDEYGQPYCGESNFKYSYTSTLTLLARRYSNTLQPKDIKPVVIATTKAKGGYIQNASVVMDADGDFTVAYALGTSTETYTYDGGITNEQGDVFVRQFADNTKTAKLAAGTAIKVSAKPKPKLAANHTLKNPSNHEPSVVITDESTNAFIVMWRSDYEDHYKDYENTTEVCTKFKTIRGEYGESYRECVAYKSVPGNAHDTVSTLKAKRYSK